MSNVFGVGGHGRGDHGHGGGGGEQHGGADGTLLCYFHPRELLVGVCAHCLRERLLLLLAAKSNNGGGRARPPADGASYLSARPYCRALRRRTGSLSSSLPKVFALGSFLQRLDSSRHHHHHHPDEVVHDHDGGGGCEDKDRNAGAEDDDAASVASLDDSFISIKFEDNGKATWVDSQQTSLKPVREAPAAAAAAATTKTTKTTALVVEQASRRGGVTRWRKQVVGRLLQLARWKRASGKQSSSSAAADQRSKVRGGGGRGWIRSLTRRRAAHGERAWS
ncbi:unnamed protein product [Triticum aestivum]|uniref:Uncharacterized protein n=4 Tax=Triticinae TaxID=1648030 RepID=A0A9R1F181_WHEAT|nr:uncharacterized protein LOC109774627 [Aegilops tauschii subsp. strangulata]XP_044335335.1 uncharacterized protein LOC123055390 [Triticum aestivum]KAF7019817.1 hypothetical protein CFC21_032952 [Triticum aestivum]SPT21039.1 unnamed protein product [Triticum aestivum]